MHDQLKKLISISEASEDSCAKALAIAGDDFVKAIKLAIYLDEQANQSLQRDAQIASLSEELQIKLNTCISLMKGLDGDFERARRLFRLRDKIRKSANITPTKFASLLEDNQYDIVQIQEAIKQLHHPTPRTVNLCGEWVDEDMLTSINPHEAVYNDDTEWPEGYDPIQNGFLYLGENADCRYENLRGFDFSILDCIAGSDFTGANLKDCSFRNMEIENVCFESIFERTNFIGTRVRNCTLPSLRGLIFDPTSRFFLSQHADCICEGTYHINGVRWPEWSIEGEGIWNYDTDTYLAPKVRILADLSNFNLSSMDFTEANFSVGQHRAIFHRAILHNTKLHKANCERLDFSEANLKAADLTEAHCQKANFSKTNMQEVTLTKANCSQADFSNANLSKSILRSTICAQASFIETDLSFTDLQTSNLDEADLTNATLKRARLIGTSFQNAIFSNTDCTNAVYDNTTVLPSNNPNFLSGAINLSSDMVGMDLSGQNLEGYDFSGKDLTGVNFTGAILEKASFKGSNLSHACLQDANLFDANLEKANITNANLSGANLTWARFSETIYNDSTQWPLKQTLLDYMKNRREIISA